MKSENTSSERNYGTKPSSFTGEECRAQKHQVN